MKWLVMVAAAVAVDMEEAVEVVGEVEADAEATVDRTRHPWGMVDDGREVILPRNSDPPSPSAGRHGT